MTSLLERIALRAAGLPSGPTASTPLRPPVGEESQIAEIDEEVVADQPRRAAPSPATPAPPRTGFEPAPPPPGPAETREPPRAQTGTEPAAPAARPAPAPPQPAISTPASSSVPRVFRAPLEQPAEAPAVPTASPTRQVAPAAVAPTVVPRDVPVRAETRPGPETNVRPTPVGPRKPAPLAPAVRPTIVGRVETTRVVAAHPARQRPDAEEPAETVERHAVELVPELREVIAEPPRELDAGEPSGVDLAPPHSGPAAATPEIEVTIGTIELQLAPEPAARAPAAAAPPGPQGFAAYAGIR
jgi:hypothetical protein